MTVPYAFPNSTCSHQTWNCHPIVQFLQEEKYNRQKGLITKLINFFRTNCHNANFNQTQWNQVKQQLENQLHRMESSCLDFLKLLTLTFNEAIDMGQDFADSNLILCLLQDQLQLFHLDSFSSSASSSIQRSASSFLNSRPKKQRLQKQHQF
jgi:hypothetical protein